MTKANNKTQPTKASVTNFIKALPDKKSQAAAKVLLTIFKEATNTKPVMWGNIFGFGFYHYKYESGREGDFLATGFAMRKSGPVIYIMPGYNNYSDLMEKLGPHKLGKSCLYLKSLENINLNILKKLIKTGLKDLQKSHVVK